MNLVSKLALQTTSVMAILGIPSVAFAATLTPSSFEASINIGQTVRVNKTVTLDASGPVTNLVDVFFLADNTGSMGGILNSVKNSASSILDSISGGDSRFSGIDVAFGVGRYFGDPVEGVPLLNAYNLLSPISKDKADTQAAINNWIASGGGDTPEANTFALHQVATSGGATDGIGSSDTGVGTGLNTGWRDNAGRIIVWFGDASSHTETVDLDEVEKALTDNKVKVAAINTRSAGSGIDEDGQASEIASATDGNLTNGVNPDAAITAILNAVGDAVSTTDLELFTTGDTSGLDINFTCTDSLGCKGVGAGESRTLAMDITGKVAGVYNFETKVRGLADAVEKDKITVTSKEVPEPISIFGSLTAATFGVELMRKRKRMQAAKEKAQHIVG